MGVESPAYWKDLSTKYEDPDAPPSETRFASALGLDLTNLNELERAICDSLPEQPHGVSWWEVRPDFTHRHSAIIGDFLLCSVRGIRTNLVEAQIHLREAEHWKRQETSQLRDSLKRRGGQIRMSNPAPACPAYELPRYLLDIHYGGILRGLASALDCLGIAAAAILGLNKNLRTASFKHVTGHGLNSHEPQYPWLERLLTHLSESGPKGWDTWLLGLRNSQLHRPRRMHTSGLKTSPMLNNDGLPYISDVVWFLPNQPHQSDGESFATHRDTLLSEDAMTTLREACSCTEKLVQRWAQVLNEIWFKRQTGEIQIVQPTTQWKSFELDDSIAFDGFRPNSEQFDWSSLTTNPDFVRRLQNLGLDGDRKKHW